MSSFIFGFIFAWFVWGVIIGIAMLGVKRLIPELDALTFAGAAAAMVVALILAERYIK